MPYGLTEIELEKLQSVFARVTKLKEVILFGSRAKGTFKPFSDVDITLVGDELTRTDLNQVFRDLDDLLLPYQFDVSLWSNLKNEALLDHIKRRGIVIYQKECNS